MSDDGSGSTQNVKSVYPKRSLFQFSDAFSPQPSGERQSTQASLSHELRHRDGHGQSINPESFIVDIPLYDERRQIDDSTTGSNISTYDASSNASCSNNAFSAGSQSPSVSSNESQNNYSIDGECSSTNNSSSNKDSSYETTSSEETSDGEVAHVQEKEHSTTWSSSDTGNESQKSLDSNKDDSVSDSTSCKDSSDETVDYQQYMCQSNRNINAKKRKKSDKESEEESLVDEDKKKKKHKRRRSSSSGRRKSKDEGDDSEGEKSGSEGHKRRRSRSHSKSGKHRSGKKGKDKKGRRKSRSGSRKRKKKGEGKEKGKPWNSFVNIFTKDTPYPPSVYFILGSEFCERFTYYGLRTILVLYLTGWLGLAKNEATAIFHLFSCLAYFSPILGAIIADGFLGRYKTILYISFIYTLGCAILSVTALPPPEIVGPMVGLFLISIGTGGIKPCVVTFGGDQFPPKQIKRRATFFSTFYFIINIGSMLSTIITPVLRSDVHCVEDSCYPLAFGVPALLMTLALIVFFAGHSSYTHVPPTGSLFSKTVKCICHAMGSSYKPKPKKGHEPHWLDAAGDIYDKKFIEEVKRMTRLIWLFLPLPLFWALFNQQGSRWTLQAAQLDGTIGLLGRLKPDQMQALNPLFILLLIPVFERVVYPCINSCGIPNRPLQRMVVGMLFTGLAFCLAAILQMKIDHSNEDPLEAGQSGYTIINTMDCKINVHGDPSPFFEGNVPPFGKTEYQRVASGVKDVRVSCAATGLQAFAPANLTERNASRLVVTSQTGKMDLLVLDDKREKSTNGTGYVSFLHLLAWVDAAKIRVSSTRDEVDPVIMKVSLQNATFFHVFEPGSYQIAFPSLSNSSEGTTTNVGGWQDVGKPFEVGSGGVYTVALIDPSTTVDLSDILVETYVNVKENSLSMMLMIPQYIIITIGEILFSISGLAFAYTQAPESMKSVIQACWLLTTSVGDLIVIFVAEVRIVPNQMAEFFLFAGLMFADSILFGIMSCFYTYIRPAESTSKGKKGKGKKGKGKKGKGKKGKGKKGEKGSGQKKRGQKKGTGKGSSKKRRGSTSKGEDDEGEGEEKDKKSKKDKKHKKKGGGDEKTDKKKKKGRRKSGSESEEEEDKDKKKKRRRKSKGGGDEEEDQKGRRKSEGGSDTDEEGEKDERKGRSGRRRSSSGRRRSRSRRRSKSED